MTIKPANMHSENCGGFLRGEQSVQFGVISDTVRGDDFLSNNLSDSVQQKIERVFGRIIHFVNAYCDSFLGKPVSNVDVFLSSDVVSAIV